MVGSDKTTEKLPKMNEFSPSQDRGHIFRLEPAEGWVAIFSTPYEPYYAVKPLVQWAHIKRDGEELVEGMIPEIGSPFPVFASEIPEKFFGYINVPLYTSQLFIDTNGYSAYNRVCEAASRIGYGLANSVPAFEATVPQENSAVLGV